MMEEKQEKVEPPKKNVIFPGHSKAVDDLIAQKSIGRPNELIIKEKSITRYDLNLLIESQSMVNDEVVDHYLNVIVERDPNNVFAFSTLFFIRLL